MNKTTQTALENRLLAMADDEIVLAHRNSEWIGHAPILEEDIALANISQDELGHASVWYDLYCNLTGDDPDALVFQRDAEAYRNAQLLELPKGDWAFTILRQFFFDAYELTILTFLRESSYQPLAEAAVKIYNEELYHYRHSAAWVKRLGLGTEESHRRMQTAVTALYPYAQQLFLPLAGEDALTEAGIWGETAVFQQKWLDITTKQLTEANLDLPDAIAPATSRAEHTSHLTDMLAEMQQVARLDPAAQW